MGRDDALRMSRMGVSDASELWKPLLPILSSSTDQQLPSANSVRHTLGNTERMQYLHFPWRGRTWTVKEVLTPRRCFMDAKYMGEKQELEFC